MSKPFSHMHEPVPESAGDVASGLNGAPTQHCVTEAPGPLCKALCDRRFFHSPALSMLHSRDSVHPLGDAFP